MGLYMDLKITNGDFSMLNLGGLEIKRAEALTDRSNPEDETHPYQATVWKSGKVVSGPVTFEHRYGDGAWTCVRRALEALDQ